MIPREDILAETGRALRGARQARGMTLRDVGTRSNGRFKPTAVAGYERAERGISLERFCELAQLYGMGPERLLLQIMWRLAGGPDPTINRARVQELPDEEADVVGGFLQRVRDLRADADDEVITVRVQDLEVLATVSGHQLRDFLDHLEPALVTTS
ncbi:MAG: helix-turn-helix transcriptional regulator [Actinomycetota bacterium]